MKENKAPVDPSGFFGQHVAQGEQWMMNNGIVDPDIILNNVLLQCLLCDKKVKNATLDEDASNRTLSINIFLSRFNMIFSSKELLRSKILLILQPLAQRYAIEVKFFIFKRK